MLIGGYLHSVDAKGRVFIPAKLRQDLGSTFYVNDGIDDCIRAYNETEWQKVMELLNQGTVESNNMRRRILSHTYDVTVDAQGRILLPEELRREVGITDQVKIVGMIEWVEFWNPDRYNEEQDESGKDKKQIREETKKSMLAIGMK
ncbi:MAG: division/cell wall cluster transcriptional repressor MraZ [Clostridia bacterium]|nr:division/cell wall cluster transcriptional repressor MraZ [Clostridia bacterium]MBQ9993449.1 division/cell wall cluster transcriptional repressor MraZ [Clostridia bacterium]